MKKNILSILIFVMCLLALVSCKPNTQTSEVPSTPTVEKTPTVDKIEETNPDEQTKIPTESVPTETPEVTVIPTTPTVPNDPTQEETQEPTVPPTAVEPTLPDEPTSDIPTIEPTLPDEPTTDVPTQGEDEPTVDSTPEPIVKYYTVIWKNYDGEELEIDSEVLENTIPTYEGITPTKPGTSAKYYTFSGWTPEITAVTEDTVYTATFTETLIEVTIEGTVPVFSNDGKTVTYGLYPQTKVSDTTLINTLETLEVSSIGWYFYNGNYYHKDVAKVYNNESYNFDDGSAIVNGSTYWYKCEPITWNILSNDGYSYYLVSSKLLDVQNFYQNYNNRVQNDTIIYSNNYEKSDLRDWLNDYFYNTAFTLNNTFITTTNVDNSSSTTDSINNKYSCNTTLDKVFLPTYKDYLNQDLGFDTTNTLSKTRECKTTDYARANGAFVNKDSNRLNNGTYWTRSACSEYYYCTWIVNTGGYLSTYTVDGDSHCVRPSIYISISK